MKRRIAAVALISSTIALALFLIPLAIAVLTLSLADARSALEREALQAATQIDPGYSAADQPEIGAAAPGQQLGFYATGGELLVGTGPARADGPVQAALDGKPAQSNDDGWISVAVPVASSEAVTGAMRAAMPVAALWQRVGLTWLVLLTAAGVALLVSLIAARNLARKITEPMGALTRASQALGGGDFSIRTLPSGLPEIDQAAAALNVTAERLGELVRRERHLSAQTSHQLRTPLTGLHALLENGLADPAANLRLVVQAAIQRADQLEITIDDIIGLSRDVQLGTAIDTDEQIDAAADRWRGPLAREARRLNVVVDSDLPPVTLVASALQQVLDALIQNALQHGAGAVTLHARETHGALAIDVEDEGTKIAATDTIFDHGVSYGGGSGIGLALAQQLTTDQGGRLLLAQRQPSTRFTLIFPRRENIR